MNNYVFLVVGVFVIYFAITGRLIKFVDVLRKPTGAMQSGGGGKSGIE